MVPPRDQAGPMPTTIPCWIYKSPRQDEMYLYLTAEDGLDAVPPPLLERFGTPQLVMQIDLHPGRTLAREDVVQVMANLSARGYHLQMPPQVQASLYEGD
jgi:uncharacterized protein